LLNKLKIIIFIGLISFFVGEIKADENICNYSKVREYDKCLKKGFSKRVISWPFFIGDSGKFRLLKFREDSSGWSKDEMAYQLRSDDGNELTIVTGKVRFMIELPFKKKYSIKIPENKILSWSVLKNTFDKVSKLNTWTYQINFLDQNLNEKNIRFYIYDDKDYFGFRHEGDLISEFLTSITGMKPGYGRSNNYINNLILNEIKITQKRLDIIRSIIKDDKILSRKCFEAKGNKFPELVKDYNNLYRKFINLQAKLDSLSLPDTQPICN